MARSNKRMLCRKKNKKRNQSIGFTKAVGRIKKHVLKGKPKTLGDAIKIALKTTKTIKNKIKPTRIVKILRKGGILLLIQIFAGLSALGSLTGGCCSNCQSCK